MEQKNKYICKMLISHNRKDYPIGSKIELTPTDAMRLIESGAIETIDGASMIAEMEAQDMIKAQTETIKQLNASYDSALKAKDELERALLQSKAEFADLKKRYEESESKVNELQAKIDELESQRQVQTKKTKKTEEK